MNALMALIDFFVRQETRIVGHNGEMADYDNPHGHVFGEVYFVVARVSMIEGYGNADDGKQWAHGHGFRNENAALVFLDRVQQAKSVDEQYWQEIEPAYGTQAWLNWNADHPETWND